jgi:RimJ/RimL family protein N-acetyltransferase
MIRGTRIALRPIRDEDWSALERWAQDREALWGPFQRYQLDHLPQLREAFQKTGLLNRQAGFLMIEILANQKVIGFVRYTLLPFPDADIPNPEIGYGIAEIGERGKGYAQEAVQLLVDYVFDGYPCERISAFADILNIASIKVLEKLGFQREGVLRRITFRDGKWNDMALYCLLRMEHDSTNYPDQLK